MSDPWHIGPRMRYWRERRGIPARRSRSWSAAPGAGSRWPRLGTACRTTCSTSSASPARSASTSRPSSAIRSRIFPTASNSSSWRPCATPLWATIRAQAWPVLRLATPALNPDQAGELVASLESRQITHAGVAALRAVVTAYRRLDDEIGSATLRPLVQHNVQIVKGLQTRSEDVGAALSTVPAELHQLAGWLSFDTGDYDAASGHYRAGLRAAEHAGNDAMAAHVLGWMSYLASTTTHPHEGIRIADAALQRAAKTPSRRLRASLARMKAHAHAHARGARGCARALARAATHVAPRPGPTIPISSLIRRGRVARSRRHRE